MALKIPKYSSDWDKVDPIHARDAVALWFNVNPRNPKARGVATDEINNAWNLFLEGKEQGYLNFPTPLDERRAGGFGVPYADSDYYLTRKELKAFATKISKKPLFLFPQKGKEKKYNIPPKPYKPTFDPPSWEYIKRADALILTEVFEMFYGTGRIAGEDLESFALDASLRQPDYDIYKLFAVGMIQGYFGDFIKLIEMHLIFQTV